MNKAFLFMIMLVSASFVGCIEDSTEDTLVEDNTVDETTQEEEDTNDQDVNDSEEVSEDDELITPVGNSTNMAPYVDAGTWNDDQWGEHIIYDGDYDDHDDYDKEDTDEDEDADADDEDDIGRW